MNSSVRPSENEKKEKYIADIRNLYKEGNLRKAVVMLDVFKCVPEELHEIATDAIIQTAGNSDLCYRIGLNYLTWKKERLPLNGTRRERLLSTILDIAADLERQDHKAGELWGLSKIDDPRAFETLVKIYKNDSSPERKKEVIFELGKRRKEDALPILLDYFFQQQNDLSEDEMNLLKKHPVSERIDSIHIMDVNDRDKVVAKFIQYLQDKNDYNDVLRITIADTLAILYASHITSIRSKEIIKASANVTICYGYDEYRDDPVGYIYLRDFTDFGRDNKSSG